VLYVRRDLLAQLSIAEILQLDCDSHIGNFIEEDLSILGTVGAALA